MNFVQFATTYKVVNNKLTKLPENIIPRIFPTYSTNPQSPNFGFYCKYQLLRYEPWQTDKNNAWGDKEPADEVLINCWHEFLQTHYEQANVSDWLDKLQTVIQSQEPEDEPSEEQEVTREEWMILLNLNTPFDNSEQTPYSTYDWHLDRANYSEQQITEMPTWIKTNKDQYAIDQKHFDEDISSEKYIPRRTIFNEIIHILTNYRMCTYVMHCNAISVNLTVKIQSFILCSVFSPV